MQPGNKPPTFFYGSGTVSYGGVCRPFQSCQLISKNIFAASKISLAAIIIRELQIMLPP